MGVYDVVAGKIQVKSTPDPSLREYAVGDPIPLPDGLHVGHEGAFVVEGGKVLCVAERVFDKWGNELDFGEVIAPHDHVRRAVDVLKKEMETLEEMNRRREELGLPPLRTIDETDEIRFPPPKVMTGTGRVVSVEKARPLVIEDESDRTKAAFRKGLGDRGPRLRLWLDDERRPPDGYDIWATTAEAAIGHLVAEFGGRFHQLVAHVSFDHDLGEGAGTGYDVAKWIEGAAHDGTIGPVTWDVHTANPAGRENIRRAMESAERFWREKSGG